MVRAKIAFGILFVSLRSLNSCVIRQNWFFFTHWRDGWNHTCSKWFHWSFSVFLWSYLQYITIHLCLLIYVILKHAFPYIEEPATILWVFLWFFIYILYILLLPLEYLPSLSLFPHMTSLAAFRIIPLPQWCILFPLPSVLYRWKLFHPVYINYEPFHCCVHDV